MASTKVNALDNMSENIASMQSAATAPSASSAITAGDATTPATWLAALTTAQLTLTADQNRILIEATGTARTVYVAHLDNATWRYLAAVSVGAYTGALVDCAHKGLAFGVAGGATVNVTILRR